MEVVNLKNGELHLPIALISLVCHHFFFYATFQKVLFLSSYRTLKQVKDLVHIIRRERERERQETSIIECYLQSLQDVYKPFEVRNRIGINISDGLS